MPITGFVIHPGLWNIGGAVGRRAASPSVSVKMNCDKSRRAVVVAADSTKWIVSCAVGASLLYYHNSTAILFAVGGIVNAAVTKVVKRVINAPRPDSAPDQKKVSAGMPSSHASSLAFFSVAFALLSRQPYALVGLVAAYVAAAWRVTAKYHTVPQMVAGLAFGSTSAILWTLTVMPQIASALEHTMHRFGAFVVTGVIVLLGFSIILGPGLSPLLKQIVSNVPSDSDSRD